jgi:hypothetical protein
VKQIFNQDNFLETDYLELKKVFYDKFYKLGFFNEKLSNKNIDHIYNIEYCLYKKEINIINDHIITPENHIITHVNHIFYEGNQLINFIIKSYDYNLLNELYFYYHYESDMSFFKPKEHIDYSTIDENIKCYITNFDESYDDDNQLYINMFITYALYMNNIYKKYDFTNKQILLDYCKFLYRINIIIKIIIKLWSLIKIPSYIAEKDKTQQFITEMQI